MLDWEFAIAGSPVQDLGSFLRFERAADPLVEPHFSQGYRDAWTILEATVGVPPLAACKLLQVMAGAAVLAWCVRNTRQGWPAARWILSTFAWWLVWQLARLVSARSSEIPR